MPQKKRPGLLRIISLALIISFSANELAQAAPAGILDFHLAPNPSSIQLSSSFAKVNDVFQGTSQRMLIHIQDAHTNSSAEKNMAQTLAELISRYHVNTVFIEGGTKDDSLDFLRPLASKQTRENVAKKYLMNGELNGAEYLSLSSDYNFKILGVEDSHLYNQNLKTYAAVVSKREAVLTYLNTIHQRTDSLKRRMYPKDLLAFDDFLSKFRKKEKDFTDYYALLSSMGEKYNISPLGFPNFSSLKDLKSQEEKIDFKKANTEVEALSHLLNQKDMTLRAEKLKSGNLSPLPFYEAMLTEAQKSKINLSEYPNFQAYVQYLHSYSSVKMDRLLKETRIFEEIIYQKALTDEETFYLHRLDQYLSTLKSLFSLQASPDDFDEYSLNQKDLRFSTPVLLAFLNRKLYDLGNYSDVIPSQPILDESKTLIEDFYRTTGDRDEVFLDKSLNQMEKNNIQIAVLITGGYHTPSLKQRMKERNISYLVVTPTVTEETDIARYEKILLLRGGVSQKSPQNRKSYVDLSQDYVEPAEIADPLNQLAFELSVLRDDLANSNSRTQTSGATNQTEAKAPALRVAAARLSSNPKNPPIDFGPFTLQDKKLVEGGRNVPMGKLDRLVQFLYSHDALSMPVALEYGLDYFSHAHGSFSPEHYFQTLYDFFNYIENDKRAEIKSGYVFNVYKAKVREDEILKDVLVLRQSTESNSTQIVKNRIAKAVKIIKEAGLDKIHDTLDVAGHSRLDNFPRGATPSIDLFPRKFLERILIRLSSVENISIQDLKRVERDLNLFEDYLRDTFKRNPDIWKRPEVVLSDSKASVEDLRVFLEQIPNARKSISEAIEELKAIKHQPAALRMPLSVETWPSREIFGRNVDLLKMKLEEFVTDDSRDSTYLAITTDEKSDLITHVAAVDKAMPNTQSNEWVFYVSKSWTNQSVVFCYADESPRKANSHQRFLVDSLVKSVQEDLTESGVIPNSFTIQPTTSIGRRTSAARLATGEEVVRQVNDFIKRHKLSLIHLNLNETNTTLIFDNPLFNANESLRAFLDRIDPAASYTIGMPQPLTIGYVNIRGLDRNPGAAGDGSGVAAARLATDLEVKSGLRYWSGDLKTTPIERPFRASKKGDVVDIDDLSEQRSLELERIGALSLLNGDGYISMLVAGASSRMNTKEAPEDVRALVGGQDILSKAAVPIGVTSDGEITTYLGEFGENLSRLFRTIDEEAVKTGIPSRIWSNDVGLMSNDDYRFEHETLLQQNHNYGLHNGQVRFFHQPLGAKYVATPDEVKKLKDKFKSEEAYQEALEFSLKAEEKIKSGDGHASILEGERDPLGHGEYFHQLIASGELLHMVDAGKKWFFVKNVDNYASKFDKVWLRTLGLFLSKHLDFQPEVSPRAPGQKGGSLIIMKDNKAHQLAEDPNIDETNRVRAETISNMLKKPFFRLVTENSIFSAIVILLIRASYKISFLKFFASYLQNRFFPQTIMKPTDSYWFNDAVAFGSIRYIIDLYKKRNEKGEAVQTDEEFIKELRSASIEEREAIADRGRSRFPSILDGKPAKNGNRVAVKRETNLWQSSGLVSPEIKIEAVGVRGARNFPIEEYAHMTPEAKTRELAKLRFLSTKNWTKSEAEVAKAKQEMEANLGRPVTDRELWIALETYQGNKLVSDDLLDYNRNAEILTPGLLSKMGARLALLARISSDGSPEGIKNLRKELLDAMNGKQGGHFFPGIERMLVATSPKTLQEGYHLEISLASRKKEVGIFSSGEIRNDDFVITFRSKSLNPFKTYVKTIALADIRNVDIYDSKPQGARLALSSAGREIVRVIEAGALSNSLLSALLEAAEENPASLNRLRGFLGEKNLVGAFDLSSLSDVITLFENLSATDKTIIAEKIRGERKERLSEAISSPNTATGFERVRPEHLSMVSDTDAARLADSQTGNTLHPSVLSAIRQIEEWKKTNPETEWDRSSDNPFTSKLQAVAMRLYNENKLYNHPIAQRLAFIDAVFDPKFYALENASIHSIYANAQKNGQLADDAKSLELSPKKYFKLISQFSAYEKNYNVNTYHNIRVAFNLLFDLFGSEANIYEQEYIVGQIEKELQTPGSGNIPQISAIQDLHGGSRRFLSLVGYAMGLPADVYSRIESLDQLKLQLLSHGINPEKLNARIIGMADQYDRGPDPEGVADTVRWLHQIGVGKFFEGNHDFWRALGVLQVHKYFTSDREAQGLDPVDLDSEENKQHHIGYWSKDSFTHSGWGDIELDQINQRRFNEAVEIINQQIRIVNRALSPDKQIDLLSLIDLVGVRAHFDAELKEAKAYNKTVETEKRQSKDPNFVARPLKTLPDIFSKTLEYVRERQQNYNSIIESLNRQYKAQGINLPLIDFTVLDLNNYHKDPEVIERTLWELKNFRLFYIDILGNLHMHNILAYNPDGGFAVEYGGKTGLDALELMSQRVREFFASRKTIDDSPAFRKELWEKIGDIFDKINGWYSDKPAYVVSKAEQVKGFVDDGGLDGLGKGIIGFSSNLYAPRQSFGFVVLGHNDRAKFENDKVNLPYVVPFNNGTGLVNIDYELSPGYSDRGAILTFFKRDESGEMTGFRLWGYEPGSNTIKDLTMKDTQGLTDDQKTLLQRWASGEGYMKWYKERSINESIKLLDRLIVQASAIGRYDKVVGFRNKKDELLKKLTSSAARLASSDSVTKLAGSSTKEIQKIAAGLFAKLKNEINYADIREEVQRKSSPGKIGVPDFTGVWDFVKNNDPENYNQGVVNALIGLVREDKDATGARLAEIKHVVDFINKKIKGKGTSPEDREWQVSVKIDPSFGSSWLRSELNPRLSEVSYVIKSDWNGLSRQEQQALLGDMFAVTGLNLISGAQLLKDQILEGNFGARLSSDERSSLADSLIELPRPAGKLIFGASEAKEPAINLPLAAARIAAARLPYSPRDVFYLLRGLISGPFNLVKIAYAAEPDGSANIVVTSGSDSSSFNLQPIQFRGALSGNLDLTHSEEYAAKSHLSQDLQNIPAWNVAVEKSIWRSVGDQAATKVADLKQVKIYLPSEAVENSIDLKPALNKVRDSIQNKDVRVTLVITDNGKPLSDIIKSRINEISLPMASKISIEYLSLGSSQKLGAVAISGNRKQLGTGSLRLVLVANAGDEKTIINKIGSIDADLKSKAVIAGAEIHGTDSLAGLLAVSLQRALGGEVSMMPTSLNFQITATGILIFHINLSEALAAARLSRQAEIAA